MKPFIYYNNKNNYFKYNNFKKMQINQQTVYKNLVCPNIRDLVEYCSKALDKKDIEEHDKYFQEIKKIIKESNSYLISDAFSHACLSGCNKVAIYLSKYTSVRIGLQHIIESLIGPKTELDKYDNQIIIFNAICPMFLEQCKPQIIYRSTKQISMWEYINTLQTLSQYAKHTSDTQLIATICKIVNEVVDPIRKELNEKNNYSYTCQDKESYCFIMMRTFFDSEVDLWQLYV